MSRRVIALCGLAALADGYDVQVLGLAVPGMAQTMQVSPAAFTVVFTASLTGMAFGAVGLAPLADRHGLRRLLLALLGLISATTVGAIFSTTPAMMATWRFFAGLGLGGLVPVAITLALRHATPARRNFQVTLMITCTALGSFFAGMLAPILESRWQWHGLFGVGAFLPLPILALGLLTLPADKPDASGTVHSDSPTQMPSASTPSHTSEDIDQYRGHSVGLKALFLPTLRPRTIALWALFSLSLFAIYALISWLPALLTTAGWERSAAQRAAGYMALGSVFGGPILATLVDSGHGRWAPATAYLVAAACLTAFVAEQVPPSWIIPVLTLVGACAMGSQQALGAFSALHYPAYLRATGTGWASGMGRMGAMLGPTVLGLLLAGGTPPLYGLAVLALPLIFAALLVFALPDLSKEE